MKRASRGLLALCLSFLLAAGCGLEDQEGGQDSSSNHNDPGWSSSTDPIQARVSRRSSAPSGSIDVSLDHAQVWVSEVVLSDQKADDEEEIYQSTAFSIELEGEEMAERKFVTLASLEEGAYGVAVRFSPTRSKGQVGAEITMMIAGRITVSKPEIDDDRDDNSGISSDPAPASPQIKALTSNQLTVPFTLTSTVSREIQATVVASEIDDLVMIVDARGWFGPQVAMELRDYLLAVPEDPEEVIIEAGVDSALDSILSALEEEVFGSIKVTLMGASTLDEAQRAAISSKGWHDRACQIGEMGRPLTFFGLPFLHQLADMPMPLRGVPGF